MANSRAAGAIKRVAGEPLLHFLLVGLALFAASEHYRRAHDLYRIEITPERIAALEGAYRSDYGAPADSRSREQALATWIDDEMLYREGRARGLDEGDEIVRRRVIQKVRFVTRDLATSADPDEATLRRWFEAREADYARPGTVDFAHVFFAAADDGERRARGVLARLAPQTTSAAEMGDPFPDASQFAAMTPEASRRLFGKTELATQLFTAPVGRWAGPFRSAFGWHLVRVAARQAVSAPAFERVRERVAADYAAAAADAAQRRAIDRLRGKFTIVRKDRP